MGVRRAQSPDALESLGHRTRQRRQQAAPGEDDRDPVGDAEQLGRERLDGSANEDDVGEAFAAGAARELAQAGRVGVDPDEQPLGFAAGRRVRQPAVARAQVDRDAARVAGQQVSESVIGALEALAADDVHRPSLRRTHPSSSRSISA
jgi:hypothetical protein